MNPLYHKIIDTLTTTPKDKKKYKIIQDGFENVSLPPKYFDLVFTSPPFFDMEIYEDVETQSVEKYKSVVKWKNGFLFPALRKSYKFLKVGGYLALYITDFKNANYIYDMKTYVRKKIKGFKYRGDIHWWDVNNKKTIRTIYVWKKIY